MTAAERSFWLSAQRRAASLRPEAAADLLRAYRVIRESLSDVEMTQLIASGRIDEIIDEALADRAFLPLRDRIVEATKTGFQATVKQLPKSGTVDGALAVRFDYLSPKVIDGIRKLDSRVINTLKEDVRETVRAFVENGLRDGRAPASVAREIRDIIGLAPNQEEAVRNFRRALEGDRGAGSPLSRALRDRRFDAAVKKGELTADQVDRMAGAYRRKMLAFNANTNAKTATLDAYKLGQRLSWEQARDNGVIPPGAALQQTWVTVGDDRVRDEHVAMQGETVPFDNVFSNGEMVPGESTWNCRCLAKVSIARAA